MAGTIRIPARFSVVLPVGTVNEAEEALQAQLQAIGGELLAAWAAQMEAALPEPARCRCTGRLRRNGRPARVVGTKVGDVQLPRQRYRCRGCGAEQVPLDGALGLAPYQRETLGVRAWALDLATEVSYAKAAGLLARLTGVRLSAGHVRGLALAEGGALRAAEAAAREARFGRAPRPPRRVAPPPAVAVVQVDGTMVRDRATRSHMEARVGLCYVRGPGAGRPRMRQAVTTASLTGLEAFAEQLVVAAEDLGAFDAAVQLFVTDGDEHLKRLGPRYFPGAVPVLDPWHLATRIREAAGADAPAQATTWLAWGRAGAVAPLAASIRAAAAAEPDAERRLRLGELAGYVAANARGIRNAARYLGYGSGAVEKAVDLVVGRRLKRQGRSWLRPGADRLLALRVLKANGDWDAHWAARRCGSNSAAA